MSLHVSTRERHSLAISREVDDDGNTPRLSFAAVAGLAAALALFVATGRPGTARAAPSSAKTAAFSSP
jgi:hypothetical protein